MRDGRPLAGRARKPGQRWASAGPRQSAQLEAQLWVQEPAEVGAGQASHWPPQGPPGSLGSPAQALQPEPPQQRPPPQGIWKAAAHRGFGRSQASPVAQQAPCAQRVRDLKSGQRVGATAATVRAGGSGRRAQQVTRPGSRPVWRVWVCGTRSPHQSLGCHSWGSLRQLLHPLYQGPPESLGEAAAPSSSAQG